MSNIEQTLSIIKPDAVERNLTEDIKSIFEKNNLKILNNKKKNNKTIVEILMNQKLFRPCKILMQVFF